MKRSSGLIQKHEQGIVLISAHPATPTLNRLYEGMYLQLVLGDSSGRRSDAIAVLTPTQMSDKPRWEGSIDNSLSQPVFLFV